MDIAYPGKHIRNIHDKSDTFTVEGVNADLRHYIPVLTKNQIFPHSLETLKVVVAAFVDAYNRFGVAKAIFRKQYGNKKLPFGIGDCL